MDYEQSRAVVVHAIGEIVAELDFEVPEGTNPYLADDLHIDEFCLAELIDVLGQEFEVSVPSDEAEEWMTFRDMVSGMMKFHNQSIDDDDEGVDMGDFDDD